MIFRVGIIICINCQSGDISPHTHVHKDCRRGGPVVERRQKRTLWGSLQDTWRSRRAPPGSGLLLAQRETGLRLGCFLVLCGLSSLEEAKELLGEGELVVGEGTEGARACFLLLLLIQFEWWLTIFVLLFLLEVLGRDRGENSLEDCHCRFAVLWIVAGWIQYPDLFQFLISSSSWWHYCRCNPHIQLLNHCNLQSPL